MPKASEHRSAKIQKLPYHYKERRDEIFFSFISINLITYCWEWVGAKRPDGYGSFCGEPAQWYVWSLCKEKRDIYKEICHSCNNKNCVSPNHLYEATHQQNMIDAARDRLMGRPIIAKEKTEEIKRLLALGKNQYWIAKQVGTSQAHVSRVKHNLNGRGKDA